MSTIRRRTVWFSAAVFAIAWTLIFAQLVAGHDPALAPKRARLAALAERRAGGHVPRPARHRRRVRHHHPHHVQPASASTPAAPATSTPAPAAPSSPPPAAPAPAPAPAPVVTSQS